MNVQTIQRFLQRIDRRIKVLEDQKKRLNQMILDRNKLIPRNGKEYKLYEMLRSEILENEEKNRI